LEEFDASPAETFCIYGKKTKKFVGLRLLADPGGGE
jgi:hypothetical protein